MTTEQTKTAMKRGGSRRVVFWAGMILGVALLAVLVLRYDPDAVLAPLLVSKPHLLLAVIAIQAAIQVLNSATPVALLGPTEDGTLRWWAQARVFLAVQPLALFAPARLSDFGALPLLKRHHRPGAVASSIVVDRLITLFFLLLMTPLALRLAWPINSSPSGYIAAAVGLALVISAPFFLVSKRLRSFVNRRLLSTWPSLLQGFGAHLEGLLHGSRRRVLVNLSLTALKTILGGAAIALLAQNFGLSLSVFTAFWMSVLIQVATSVPIAPQGLGIAEGSLVLLFEANGLPGALALSVGVMGRLLFIPVIAGIYLTATLPLLAERLGESEAGLTAHGTGLQGPKG